MPLNVLVLPDLAAQELSTEWWSSMGSRVFWIGILLGTLLAAFLIWNPPVPEPRQLDEAPAWSGNAKAQHHLHADRYAAGHGEAGTNDATSSPQPSRGSASAPQRSTRAAPETWPNADPPSGLSPPAAMRDSTGELPVAPTDHESGPSFDDWSGKAPAHATTRTARREDAHWDGTASDAGGHYPPNVSPGEAAPTGTINPAVNE